MTQSTGADAPEKTVNIIDLCDRMEMSHRNAEGLQEFMGQEGPWTEAEAAELLRRMASRAEADRFPGYTGKPIILLAPATPEGYTREDALEILLQQHPEEREYILEYQESPEKAAVMWARTEDVGPVDHPAPYSREEVQALVNWWVSPATDHDQDFDQEGGDIASLIREAFPGLADALGFGATPAEKRTGVSDPEAAILEALDQLQRLVDKHGKACANVGVATVHRSMGNRAALGHLMKAQVEGRAAYNEMGKLVANIGSWLARCKGLRAVDGEGLPIWFLPASVEPSAGWLTTAQAESPGENWMAVYIR